MTVECVAWDMSRRFTISVVFVLLQVGVAVLVVAGLLVVRYYRMKNVDTSFVDLDLSTSLLSPTSG